MRWQDLEESSSVEDRRGMGGMRRSGGLRTRGGIPLRGKTGLAVVIVVLVAGYYGIDLTPLLTGEPFPVETQTTASAPYKGTAAEEELAKFSRVALKTTEDVWTEIFRATGIRTRSSCSTRAAPRPPAATAGRRWAPSIVPPTGRSTLT